MWNNKFLNSEKKKYIYKKNPLSSLKLRPFMRKETNKILFRDVRVKRVRNLAFGKKRGKN